MKLDFDDILITPDRISSISSRKEVDTRRTNSRLPLFVAPMDTVVDEKNYKLFLEKGLNVALSRTMFKGVVDIYDEGCFTSMGLSQFKNIYLEDESRYVEMFTNGIVHRVLIDIANGHMQDLLDSVKRAKSVYGHHLIIMAGNIANPHTYSNYADAGLDYIRVGIGNGGGCLTTANVGIGYPMASLILETREIRRALGYGPKIVADGGFKKYSDIIKALALGADYVMLGSIFNKALESAGETYEPSSINSLSIKVDQYHPEILKSFKSGNHFFKKFRGMSTKEAQKAMGNEILKTSEGVTRIHKVEYTLDTWLENFEDYLRSAMSYTNSKTLNEFIGEVEWVTISENSFKRFNK